MKPLKNRQHEIFAQELAAGAPLLSAFQSAGYKDSSSARYNASRLRNSPAVRERVNELLAQSAKRRHGTAPGSTVRRNAFSTRSEEHTSELQSPDHLVCRLLLEKKTTNSRKNS